MNKLIPLLVCLAFTGSASASTIFSCDLSNKHNVNIDSSNQRGLAYEYGKVGSNKLDLTLENESSSFGDYMGPYWEYKYFRFARGDYSYVVYDKDGRTQGLAVYQGKKLLMNKKCASNIEHNEIGYTAASNQIKHDSEDDAFSFMPDDTSPSSDNSASSSQQQQEPQTQQPPTGQTPIKVSIGLGEDNSGSVYVAYKKVSITSVIDNLTINKVIVNRGQCHENVGNPKSPYTLNFGATKEYDYIVQIGSSSYNCDIIEIIAKTNQGDWTFKPNQ